MKNRTRQQGFTLVEILIVVMILGILAALIIPRYASASDEARRAAVSDQLRLFRDQINLYSAEHRDTLPGVTASAPAGNVVTFVAHLTNYSDASGNVAATKSATHKLGPYLPTIPSNPISGTATVKIDLTTNPVPAADEATGWIFQPRTGRLSINSGALDASGKAYVSY